MKAKSVTNSSLIEVEVKLHTPDLSVIQHILEQAGATLTSARTYERNVRYDNTKSTLSQQGIVLRMRQDTQAKLTYKDAGTVDNGIIQRFEAEVIVSDFDTMDTILRLLRFEPYLTYEKYRTTYSLNNAEIVLDELPYGNFTEIEANVTTIEHLIEQLDLDDYQRMPASYTRLFENVKDYLGLDMDDLTFDNFDGIDVPTQALYSAKTL